MLTQPLDTNDSQRPSLADLLAEPEPMREARRLLVWICAVSRHPPLDRDLVTAMAARCHAEAMCTALQAALRAPDPGAALRDADHARRALLHLRAVLYVALSERLLHKVQFDILSRQAGRTKRALDALAARASGLGAAWRRGESPSERDESPLASRRGDNRPATRRPEEEP